MEHIRDFINIVNEADTSSLVGFEEKIKFMTRNGVTVSKKATSIEMKSGEKLLIIDGNVLNTVLEDFKEIKNDNPTINDNDVLLYLLYDYYHDIEDKEKVTEGYLKESFIKGRDIVGDSISWNYKIDVESGKVVIGYNVSIPQIGSMIYESESVKNYFSNIFKENEPLDDTIEKLLMVEDGISESISELCDSVQIVEHIKRNVSKTIEQYAEVFEMAIQRKLDRIVSIEIDDIDDYFL